MDEFGFLPRLWESCSSPRLYASAFLWAVKSLFGLEDLEPNVPDHYFIWENEMYDSTQGFLQYSTLCFFP